MIIIVNWNTSVSYLSVPFSYLTNNMKQVYISFTRIIVADFVYSHCFMISHIIILADFPPCITPWISVQPVTYTNTLHYLCTVSKQSISVFFSCWMVFIRAVALSLIVVGFSNQAVIQESEIKFDSCFQAWMRFRTSWLIPVRIYLQDLFKLPSINTISKPFLSFYLRMWFKQTFLV